MNTWNDIEEWRRAQVIEEIQWRREVHKKIEREIEALEALYEALSIRGDVNRNQELNPEEINLDDVGVQESIEEALAETDNDEFADLAADILEDGKNESWD